MRLPSNTVGYWLAALVLISLPAALGLYMPYARGSITLTDLTPLWSDELFYWHQIASFREVGLDSGYYTFREQPAQASFARYYAWGLAVPVLYGVPSVLFGWELHSMPYYNLGFLTLGLAVYVLLLRPSLVWLLLLSLTVASFPSFLVYSTSSLLPVMELGMALGLAGLLAYHFYRPSRAKLWALVIVLALFALVRTTWALLAFPLFLCLLKRWRWRDILGALAAAVIFNIVMWGIMFYTAAPYPNLPRRILAAGSASEAFDLWLQHVDTNLSTFFSGDLLEIHLRGQVGIVLLIVGVLLLGYVWRKNANGMTVRLLFIGGSQLLMVTLFALVLYDTFDWRDFRLIAPALLLVCALAVAVRHWVVVLFVLATSFAIVPDALKVYDLWLGSYFNLTDREAFYAWRAEMVKVVAYDPDAPSAWCNTVVISSGYLFNHVTVAMGLDPGLGLSFYDTPSSSLQSRWLLLEDRLYHEYESFLNLERLMTVPDGALYRNLDSACPD